VKFGIETKTFAMHHFRISIFLVFLTITWFMPVRLAPADDLAISIPIQLTHAQNFDPSPDGKLIFISVISGKEQLFTMETTAKTINSLSTLHHKRPALAS
jgi:hypothetical protein